MSFTSLLPRRRQCASGTYSDLCICIMNSMLHPVSDVEPLIWVSVVYTAHIVMCRKILLSALYEFMIQGPSHH